MGVDVLFFVATRGSERGTTVERRAIDRPTIARPRLDARYIEPLQLEDSVTEVSARALNRWERWPEVEQYARMHLAGLAESQELWYVNDHVDWDELHKYIGTSEAFRCDEEFLATMRGTYEALKSRRHG